MANVVNLIDGLDGLAAGVMAIAAAAFLIYSLRLDSVGAISEANVGPLVAMVILGICVGFLLVELPSGEASSWATPAP